jgi:hypothetical protein
MVFAVLSAISVFVTLHLAVSQAHHAKFYDDRAIARYAAEAALVWAREQIWINPMGAAAAACFPQVAPAADFTIDHDGNGATPVISVDVTAAPCPAPGTTSQLSAKVIF